MNDIATIAALLQAGVPAKALPAILAGLAGNDVPKARRGGRKGRFAPKGKPFGQKLTPEELVARDVETVAGFKRKGFNVTLMDRNDPTKPFDVRPFGKSFPDGKKTGWLAEGRVVRKGQHGVNGLFHISQTDPLPDQVS